MGREKPTESELSAGREPQQESPAEEKAKIFKLCGLFA
jgi:hypothetical protein